MLILTIRTDKPESEIGLYEDEAQLAYEVWQAHRQLAETINIKIEQLLKSQGKRLEDLQAIVCYKGPGSFTGLRIGISVANAMAYGLEIPIVGVAEEDKWLQRGIERIISSEDDKIVVPEYGAPAHITKPKH